MRIRNLLLLTLLLAVCSAQAQFIPKRVNLFMGAKYSELAQLVESEIKDDPNPLNSKLALLCFAYGKLKIYNKLFPCLERAEANVARGDIAMVDLDEMRKNSPLLFGLAAMGSVVVGGTDGLKGDCRPYLYVVRAEAYNELGDHQKAIPFAQKAYEHIPRQWNEERPVRIMALTQLGLSHAFAGNKDKAAKYAEELAAISTSYPHTGLTNDKVMGLARIYMALGDYPKAYEGLRSDSVSPLGAVLLGLGDVLGGRILGGMDESMFTWMELPKSFMTAKTLLEVGKTQEAKELYDKLLAEPRVRDNGEIYWLLLHDRGRIASGEGDAAVAIDHWRKAVAIIEQQRSSINTEANKIGFVGDKQSVYRRLFAALVSAGRLEEAFDILERSKSRALVDLLASKKDFSTKSGDAQPVKDILAKVEQLELTAYAQDATLVKSSDAVPGTGRQRSGRSAEIAQELKKIEGADAELASLVSVSATPIRDIQATLGEKEALLEYFYDEAKIFIFVLTREGLKIQEQALGALDADVRALREHLSKSDNPAYLEVSKRLYGRLVAPVDGLLSGKDSLIVVPHGVLHYLPFAALHDGSNFLIDQRTLRFLPSASVTKYLRAPQQKKPNGVLAMGNPDLGHAQYSLQFAEEEARLIAQIVPNSKVLVRQEVTVDALRELAPNYNYLHFAMHGKFSQENPLDSALLLSRSAGSDGLLTVNKLYSMRLDVDLATLSACETGLGKIANGDDVVGLNRGFLYAGASSVISSLWEVDDQATAELMKRFYLGLQSRNKSEALRTAQKEMREKFPHPYYWGAFQLTGNAQ